jgi:hypothetical protein
MPVFALEARIWRQGKVPSDSLTVHILPLARLLKRLFTSGGMMVSRTSTGGFNELAVLQLCCRLSGIGVRVISYLSVYLPLLILVVKGTRMSQPSRFTRRPRTCGYLSRAALQNIVETIKHELTIKDL